jgi:hypothetical protein
MTVSTPRHHIPGEPGTSRFHPTELIPTGIANAHNLGLSESGRSAPRESTRKIGPVHLPTSEGPVVATFGEPIAVSARDGFTAGRPSNGRGARWCTIGGARALANDYPHFATPASVQGSLNHRYCSVLSFGDDMITLIL